jgi:hypothetical protein
MNKKDKTAVEDRPEGKIDVLDSSGGKLDRFIVQGVMCCRVHSSWGYLDFLLFFVSIKRGGMTHSRYIY